MSVPEPKAFARFAALALAFDLGHLALASCGRDTYLSLVLRHERPFAFVSALAIFALAIHVGAAVRVARRPARAHADADTRRLQSASGMAILAMLAVHAATWPIAGLLEGTHAFGGYQRMRTFFPTPLGIAIHAAGTAGLALHLQQGLRRLLRSRGRPVALAVAASGTLAAVVYVVYFDALAAFTIGRTFIPR